MEEFIRIKSRRFGYNTEWIGIIDRVVRNAEIGQKIAIISNSNNWEVTRVPHGVLAVGMAELAKDNKPLVYEVTIDKFKEFIKSTTMTPTSFDDCTTVTPTNHTCNSYYLTIEAIKPEDYEADPDFREYDAWLNAMQVDLRVSHDAAIRVKEQRLNLLTQPVRIYSRKMMSSFSKVLPKVVQA